MGDKLYTLDELEVGALRASTTLVALSCQLLQHPVPPL
jgi:hypothetical protein